MPDFSLWAWVGVGVVALSALLAGWRWLWVPAIRWLYRVPGERPERHRVRCEDGWELAVYRRVPKVRRFKEPVLLAHGLATNHYFFDFFPPHSLADFLAGLGFESYSVEWRGTGASRLPPRGKRWGGYSADDHIRFDAPAFIAFALEHSGASQAFWLGHSLGGLVGYGIAPGPWGEKLKGLLVLGAPVFFGYGSMLKRLVQVSALAAWPFGFRYQLAGAGVAPFYGYVPLPLSDLALNPKNMSASLQRRTLIHAVSSISRPMLLQFRDWTYHDTFRSLDRRTDYREGLKRIRQPALVMGGSQDRLATPAAIQRQYELLASEDKTLTLFGRDRGDRQDYGHGDLALGEHAPEEVYPVIGRWLETRATGVDGSTKLEAGLRA